MQNENTKPTNPNDEAAKPPVVPGLAGEQDYERKIIEKIRGSENILVALSKQPSIDELAAAIGLTVFLDGLQKHTTAIYSGKSPEALEFLAPKETFETNTDSLQDFIISLSKDKADHLRYKLEGDEVKVYITPYKTTLSEADLQFSHGDYNVDLVLALSVATAADLDEALSEHGRILHDASTVDITAGEPGRFGEIEWSDSSASSVSEMVTRLIFTMNGQEKNLEENVATALLTGIVAATGRFSNERTNPTTLEVASKLMTMGANQQLISTHVVDNVLKAGASEVSPIVSTPEDKSSLMIGKDYGMKEEVKPVEGTVVTPDVPGVAEAVAEVKKEAGEVAAEERVKAQQEMQAAAEAAVNQAVGTAVTNAAAAGATGTGVNPAVAAAPTVPEVPSVPVTPVMSVPTFSSTSRVTVGDGPVLPPASKDYGQMIEQALAEPLPVETAASAAGLINNVQGTGPVTSKGVMEMPADPQAPSVPQPVEVSAGVNVMPENVVPSGVEMVSSASAAPVNTVPMPTPGEATASVVVAEPVANNAPILPPAPAPDVGSGILPPVLPPVQPVMSGAPTVEAAPSVSAGVAEVAPGVNVGAAEVAPGGAAPVQPGAFQIPGAN